MPDAAPPPDAAPAPAPTVAAFDPKTGAPVQVPAADFPAEFLAGRAALPAGSRVPVFKDGVLGSVPVERAHEAFANPAVRVASSEEVEQHQLQKQYGGAGQQAIAGLEGAASGATLGLSDVAEGALLGNQEDILARQKANPVTHAGAQLLGAVVPGLLAPEAEGVEGAEIAKDAGTIGRLLDGGKGVVSALGAPSRMVAGLGGAVEKGAGTLLGETEGAGLIAGLAKRAIAKGAAGAVEGAVYGGAQHLDEEALGDPDLAGESLLASVGHGALLGLAAGGALSAAGDIGSAVLGRVAPKLSGMAEEQAVRAIEPHAAGARALADVPGGARGAGRMMLDDGILQAGDTLEQIAPKIAKARADAGQAVGAIYKAADEAGIEGPKLADVAATIETNVLSDLRRMPESNAGAIKAVEARVRDMFKRVGIPSVEDAAAQGVDLPSILSSARVKFQDAQALKTDLGKTINWKKSPFPTSEDKANEALKDVYREFSRHIDAAGEKAAREMGGSFAADLKAANVRYQTYSTLDRIAQNSSRLAEGRNIASPSTKAAGMMGTTAALVHGSTGPVGLATGAASAAMNHLLNTRGPATAAAILDKLATLRGVQRAQASVERQMNRGVAAFFRDHGRADLDVRPLTDPYRDHTEAVRRANAARDEHAAAVEQAAAPIAQHAPKVAAAFQQAAIRATQYLGSKAPQHQPPPSLTPQFDHARTTPQQEHGYMLEAQAVHDPMSVLDDMAKGRVTHAQVEAFRKNFPKLAEKADVMYRERLQDLTKPLDYEQRKQLAVWFGAAAGPEFDPKFIARMQGDFSSGPAPAKPAAGPKAPPRGGAPKRKLDGASEALKLP